MCLMAAFALITQNTEHVFVTVFLYSIFHSECTEMYFKFHLSICYLTLTQQLFKILLLFIHRGK